ncbi:MULTISPECIES: hypothetical protein [Vibrio]|uniref:hypothetical protein n=1 Tax=Vibrio TaxID=662 RepID=UPI00296541E5|nr:hypothetical protein [Vibrio sp. YT-19(2023)]EJA7361177.1 hypothetical protein [Vibrio alginolyticus]MDW1501127.1 hypothetical protein [Vibrio sp. YT-19(2023)]
MSISGINGSNYVTTLIAKTRIQQGMITSAEVVGKSGKYQIHFTNDECKWKGENLVLCSVRSPYEPKIFKTIDGAIADLRRLEVPVPSIAFDWGTDT